MRIRVIHEFSSEAATLLRGIFGGEILAAIKALERRMSDELATLKSGVRELIKRFKERDTDQAAKIKAILDKAAQDTEDERVKDQAAADDLMAEITAALAETPPPVFEPSNN